MSFSKSELAEYGEISINLHFYKNWKNAKKQSKIGVFAIQLHLRFYTWDGYKS